MQHIALLSERLIYVPDTIRKETFNSQVYTLVANLLDLGYSVSEKDVQILGQIEDQAAFQNDLLNMVNQVTGADLNWTPMYKGYPKEVLDKTNLELLINAVVHYWTGGKWLPQSADGYTRTTKTGEVQIKELVVIGDTELTQILISWIEANVALADQQKDALSYYYALYKGEPFNISFKETLAFFAKMFTPLAIKKCRTATDLLRVASAISNGDYTLVKNTRFNLNIYHKAAIAVRFNELGNSDLEVLKEDVAAQTKRWQKLFHHLMPHKTYPNLTNLKDVATKNYTKSLQTFESKVQKAIDAGDSKAVVEILSRKPGLFVRKFNELLTKFDGEELIFINAIDWSALPNRILWQLFNYFSNRNSGFPRLVRLKTGKVKVIDALQLLKEDIRKQAFDIVKTELKSRYSKFEIGKVDPGMMKVPLPLNLRGASEGTLLPFGTRMPIGNIDLLRFGIHWFNTGNDRVDIDLHGTLFNHDLTSSKSIGWNSRYKDDNNIAVYSGDLVDAPHPNGATEFIDIDIDKAINAGYKYIMISTNMYSPSSYKAAKARFNVQALTKADLELVDSNDDSKYALNEDLAQSGNAFEADRLIHSIEWKNDTTTQTLACLLDFDLMDIVWLDIPCENGFGRSTTEFKGSIADTIYTMLNSRVASLYDLYMMFNHNPELDDVSWKNNSPYKISDYIKHL